LAPDFTLQIDGMLSDAIGLPPMWTVGFRSVTVLT